MTDRQYPPRSSVGVALILTVDAAAHYGCGEVKILNVYLMRLLGRVSADMRTPVSACSLHMQMHALCETRLEVGVYGFG
jgi:hypothetical protein